MSNPKPSADPIAQLRKLAEPAEREKLQSDAELLSLYVNGGDRRAIETLIERYAAMVASVCRLTTADSASAEDAFQATFLILLQSARKIRRGASVAAWLHGVAYRTSCRNRTIWRKQLSNQSTGDVITHSDPKDDPIAELARKFELEALDRELQKLPTRLREPLIEHYLLGHSAPDIAQRMELSTSAVEGRLRRGRHYLRTQLAKRGISLSVVLAGAGWFQQHLQAAEAGQWTSNFFDTHLPPGDGPPQLNSNPEVSSLVREEMTMFGAGTVKAGIAASIVLMAGALVAMTVNASGPAWGGGDPQGGTLTLPAPTTPAADGFVLAQTLGNTATAVDAAPANASEVRETVAGEFMTPPAASVVQWEPPTNAAGTPSWLAGGESSMAAMEKNRGVLAEKIEFDLVDIPLSEFVGWLSEDRGTQFDLNVQALEELGVDNDQPISVTGSASVRELIRRVCEPLDLTYVVTESTIEITTADDAESRQSIRFYDLAYVLPNSANAPSLISAIESTIKPDSWHTNGGNSSISIVGSMMVVSAPDTTHQSIEVLLLNVSKMNPRNAINATAPAGAGFGYGGYGGGMGGGGGMF